VQEERRAKDSSVAVVGCSAVVVGNMNAIIEIIAGPGGVEANDWAGMLERMYLRWLDRHHCKSEVLNRQPGDEAGIRSCTISVEGLTQAQLSSETGTHRLTRISPFDSVARRHTSFAHVNNTVREHEVIRTYVLQPYQLVKDLRSGVEVGNVQAVLDGGIDVFMGVGK